MLVGMKLLVIVGFWEHFPEGVAGESYAHKDAEVKREETWLLS
jgi:hypothetical protein